MWLSQLEVEVRSCHCSVHPGGGSTTGLLLPVRGKMKTCARKRGEEVDHVLMRNRQYQVALSKLGKLTMLHPKRKTTTSKAKGTAGALFLGIANGDGSSL